MRPDRNSIAMLLCSSLFGFILAVFLSNAISGPGDYALIAVFTVVLGLSLHIILKQGCELVVMGVMLYVIMKRDYEKDQQRRQKAKVMPEEDCYWKGGRLTAEQEALQAEAESEDETKEAAKKPH